MTHASGRSAPLALISRLSFNVWIHNLFQIPKQVEKKAGGEFPRFIYSKCQQIELESSPEIAWHGMVAFEWTTNLVTPVVRKQDASYLVLSLDKII